MTMTLTGDRELWAALGRLTGAVAGGTLLNAVKAGALIVQNDAKRRAPYESGTLRRSIHMETAESSRTRAAVIVGTDVEYAARQEFGFDGPDALGRVYHQSPHPYLRPARDENQAAVHREINDAAAQLIRQAAGR